MTEPGQYDQQVRPDAPGPGSDRAFGVVFAVVFAVIGLLPLLSGGGPRLWSLSVAAALVVLSSLAPRLLHAANVAWYRFGMLLHRIMTPVILALMYALVFVPVGLVLRLFGKDLLSLRLRPDAASYWIAREPPGPAPESMKNQF